jgi:hypothetical protein
MHGHAIIVATRSGVYENAEYGLALAASTTDMMPWVNHDDNMIMPYTKVRRLA